MTTNKIMLSATARREEASAEALRAEQKIPAIIYGHGFENLSVIVDYQPFEKVLAEAGESTLVDLGVGDEIYKVLIQDVQLDPVTDSILHADFRRVKLDEKVKADVILKYIGEAPAIKEQGANLMTVLETVEVEALPQDLIHEIEVDVSGLKQIGDKIYVKDLQVPAKLEVKTTPDVLVAAAEEAKVKEEKPEATPEEEEKAALEAQEGEQADGEADKEAGDKKDEGGGEKKEESKKEDKK